jgi:hypothetical protein
MWYFDDQIVRLFQNTIETDVERFSIQILDECTIEKMHDSEITFEINILEQIDCNTNASDFLS